MDKQIIKIRFQRDTNTVYVPYLELLAGVADLKYHIDRYHAIQEEVIGIANSLGTNNVMDDAKKYEFYFTLLRAEKDRVIKILNEKKDNIIKPVDPEKRLYEIEVVTV